MLYNSYLIPHIIFIIRGLGYVSAGIFPDYYHPTLLLVVVVVV